MTPEQARALAGSYYLDCNEPLAKSIANPETAKYLRTRAAGLQPSMKNLANAARSQDDEWHKTHDTVQHLNDTGAKRGKYDAIRGKPVNYEAIYHPSTDHPVEVTGDMDPIEAAVRQNVRFRNATTGAGRDRTLNTSAFFEQGPIPKDNPNRDTFESIDKGEVHIPTWEEIRKSIEKRDPRIDSSRSKAANSIEDPDLKEEIKDDAHNTRNDNPQFANLYTFQNRNPVPKPQPERKDIPVNREKYEDDQYEDMSTANDIYNNDNLREYITDGLHVDPDMLDQILHRLHSYYADNSAVASKGRYETNEILGLPRYGGSEDQPDLIEPGRR